MDRRGPLLTLVAGLAATGAVFAVGIDAVRGGAPTAVPLSRTSIATPSPNTPATPTTLTNPATGRPTTVAAVSATAGPVAPVPVTGARAWAGPVEPGATLALVIRDGRAVAYYCDGRRTEAWLTGTARDGLAALQGPGGAAATAAYGPTGVSGVIRVAGRARPFAVTDGRAELYRLASGGATGGWIVQAGNRQTGVLRVAGVPRPAPPLDLATRSVRVGSRTLAVTPVLPGPGRP